jgi:hypothetical protein
LIVVFTPQPKVAEIQNEKCGKGVIFVALFVFLAAQAELSMARHNELLDSRTVVVEAGWPYRPDHPATKPGSGIVWLDPDDSEQAGFVRSMRSRP